MKDSGSSFPPSTIYCVQCPEPEQLSTRPLLDRASQRLMNDHHHHDRARCSRESSSITPGTDGPLGMQPARVTQRNQTLSIAQLFTMYKKIKRGIITCAEPANPNISPAQCTTQLYTATSYVSRLISPSASSLGTSNSSFSCCAIACAETISARRLRRGVWSQEGV